MTENEIGPNAIGPNAIGPTINSWTIFSQYAKIMNEYLNHFTGSEKYKKGDKDRNYLLLNGFSTLTHVFKITLNCETLDLAIENTEKAIYYYTQFIEQMEENIMYDLNVSTNNASLFVYKKTINHFLPDSFENDSILKNVDYLFLIYRLVVNDLFKSNYDPLIPGKLINISMEICRNNNDEDQFRQEMTKIMFFINHFHSTTRILYDYFYLFVKKYKQCELTLEKLYFKKIQSNYFDKLVNDTPANYIKWLMV